MFRIAWQTLRSRRGTLAGAFIATVLAVTFAYATGQLMAGALSAPGPGRFGAADAVVRGDPSVTLGQNRERQQRTGDATLEGTHRGRLRGSDRKVRARAHDPISDAAPIVLHHWTDR